MRHNRANDSGDRSNALWGRGSRGEQRSNALWGRGGRRAGAVVAAIAVFAMASVAGAGLSGGKRQLVRAAAAWPQGVRSEPRCSSAIQQNPEQSFDVIVQGDRSRSARVHPEGPERHERLGRRERRRGKRQASSSARSTAAQVDPDRQADPAARQAGPASRRSWPNETVKMSGCSAAAHEHAALAVGDRRTGRLVEQSPDAATIAVVDSGIDASRAADFGGRVARPGQPDEPRARTRPVTATATARSSRASLPVRRPAMPASRRRRTCSRSTS